MTVFEEHHDTLHVRCSACQRYDPLGLGTWILRRSGREHLKRQTHIAHVQRWAEEQRQQAEDDMQRAAAYQAPVAWETLPDHDVRMGEHPNMFPASSDAREAGRTLEDLGFDKSDFHVELPAPFDFQGNAEKIHEEAELLYARLAEVRLDDKEDEDLVQELEDIVDAVNPRGGRECRTHARPACLLTTSVSIRR
jgi:hypothetical protein